MPAAYVVPVDQTGSAVSRTGDQPRHPDGMPIGAASAAYGDGRGRSPAGLDNEPVRPSHLQGRRVVSRV